MESITEPKMGDFDLIKEIKPSYNRAIIFPQYILHRASVDLSEFVKTKKKRRTITGFITYD